ncbi:hypothetical protein HK104_004515 [Borealophlyctis nickersoniae]|nr:hypothetical protein HK104_004515 [Borealophlyctis nickersoniae]
MSRDAAVIIATKAHLLAIDDKLKERRIDIDKKKKTGQLTMIDATEILLKLQLDNGRISRRGFNETIRPMVKGLVRKYGDRIYAYGEIVNVLCSRGEYAAAIELEGIWGELLMEHKFTLLCGYDMKNFKKFGHSEAFQHVCSAHSKVTPSEEYAQLADRDNQHVMVATLQQKAKALESEIERRKAAEQALQNSLKVLSSRAQEALGRERHNYRALLSTLPVGVYGTDDEDDFVINARFCQIVGRTEVEIRVGGWTDAVHPLDRDRLSSMWPFTNEPQLCETRSEYRLVLRDGSTRWVTGETVPNRDEEGNIHGFIHTIMDITQLRQAEHERLEARQAAEEHQRLRADDAELHKRQQDQWIDSLCHELRNPLNGIYGNVELLEMGLQIRGNVLAKAELDEEDLGRMREQLALDRQSVEAITKCVEHQKILTDDVLNFSKLQLGKVVLQEVEFNPITVISNVAKMFEAQASRKGINMRVNVPVSDINVKGDPHRLSQVIINLIANAIKFTDEGSITLGLDVVERHTVNSLFRVTVKDTGIGMTAEEKAILFQRFTQAPSSFHECSGSGLGLYISKGLVELMGGTIFVESKKRVGSKFTFTFLAKNVWGPVPLALGALSPHTSVGSVPSLFGYAAPPISSGSLSQMAMSPSASQMAIGPSPLGIGTSPMAISPSPSQIMIGTSQMAISPSPSQIMIGSPQMVVSSSPSQIMIGTSQMLMPSAQIAIGTSHVAMSPMAMSPMTFSPMMPSSPVVRPAKPHKKTRILVVEDNEINQNIMRRFLEVKDYQVNIVGNGAEAVAFVENNSVDLVFMDIQMPVMDGITATTEIRRREQENGGARQIPIIGLSGNAREEHAGNAMGAGMNKYITKPVRKTQLYEIIEQYAT